MLPAEARSQEALEVEQQGHVIVGTIKTVTMSESSSGESEHDYELFTAIPPDLERTPRVRTIGQLADASLMRAWLHHCKEQHGSVCEKRLLTASPHAMIRLIDTEQLMLVKGNLQMEYVALSYVWGDAKPLLIRSVEEKLSQPGGLQLNKLPKTISDAINLTRMLGQRYIWIDSACIIQDDEVDKSQQLGRMDAVYNFADVVLVAASSASAHSSIPGVSITRKGWCQSNKAMQRSGLKSKPLLPDLATCLSSSLWQTRGWTFQEGFLARRILVFDHSQVYWNCGLASHCENVFSEYRWTHSDAVPRCLLLRQDKHLLCHLHALVRASTRDLCECDYMRMVENFVVREFSKKSDTLWAFRGIMKLLKPRFPKGFIWGIPWDSIDTMLLWSTSCAFRESSAVHTVLDIQHGIRKLQFPSWTWFAKGCDLHHPKCGKRLVSNLTWHDPIPYPDGPKTESAQVSEDRSNDSSEIVVPIDPECSRNNASKDICQLRYLQFDAPVADLKIGTITRLEGCRHGQVTGQAILRSHDGQVIGTIRCSWQFPTERYPEHHHMHPKGATASSPSKEYQAELVHLSTFQPVDSDMCAPSSDEDDDPAGSEFNDWHRSDCRYGGNINLMLIEWDREHKIAYRVGLASVKESAWEKVQTQTRRIVLG